MLICSDFHAYFRRKSSSIAPDKESTKRICHNAQLNYNVGLLSKIYNLFKVFATDDISKFIFRKSFIILTTVLHHLPGMTASLKI